MSDDKKPMKLADSTKAALDALTDKERAMLDKRLAKRSVELPPEKTAKIAALDALEAAAEGQTLFGRPIDAFVKGGTHTSKHDAQVAKNLADAERRRAVADAERQLASKSIEEGGAMLATHKMTSAPQAEALYVLIRYLTPGGEAAYHKGKELQCLADVQIIGPDELQLMIVCQGCKERDAHQQDAQLRIPQSRKPWVLDRTPWDGASKSFPHRTGQPFFLEGKMYLSAGVVDCEKFSCTTCGWTARIEKNSLRPDQYRG
jgi:hypothetical protein